MELTFNCVVKIMYNTILLIQLMGYYSGLKVFLVTTMHIFVLLSHSNIIIDNYKRA